MAGVEEARAKRVARADATDNLVLRQLPRRNPLPFFTRRFTPCPFRTVDHHPLSHACRQQLCGSVGDMGHVQRIMAVADLKPAKLTGFQLVNHQIIKMAQGREHQRLIARVALAGHQIERGLIPLIVHLCQ